MPEIVWIGDSHIRRFKEWFINEYPDTFVEDQAFYDLSGWAASGGAKFHTFNQRLSGKKLPYRQCHLGDQWSELIVRHPFPFAVVLSMRSNDISDSYRRLKRWRLDDKKAGTNGTETRWFRHKFKLLSK